MNAKVVSQEYHRNGSWGNGFVVSKIEWYAAHEENNVSINFVAISFFNPENERDDGYFAENTAVLNIDDLNNGDIKTAWRGAEKLGNLVAHEWFKVRQGYSDSIAYLRIQSPDDVFEFDYRS